MMTGHDDFAIVIPAFNAARYLAETLGSAVASGSGLAEIVVVDDGSSDATAEIAAGFQAGHPRVTLIRRSNGGVARARNAGLSAVRAEYVCFLDADDVMRPGALDLLRRRLRDNPEAAAAFGQVAYIDPDSHPHPRMRPSGRPRPSAGLPDVLCGAVIDTPGAVLFRTAAVRAAGGFRPGLTIGEDWELYVRVALGGCFVATSDTVLDYRVHPVSAMRLPSLSAEDFEPAVHEVFGDAGRYADRIDDATLRRCELYYRVGVLRVLGQSSTSLGKSLRLLLGLGRLTVKGPLDVSIAVQCVRAMINMAKPLVRGEALRRRNACP